MTDKITLELTPVELNCLLMTFDHGVAAMGFVTLIAKLRAINPQNPTSSQSDQAVEMSVKAPQDPPNGRRSRARATS